MQKSRHRIIGAILLTAIIFALAMMQRRGITGSQQMSDLVFNTKHEQIPVARLLHKNADTGSTVLSFSSCTVSTGQDDYAPGDLTQITANGFEVGETVEFLVLHTDGAANTGNGHEPWMVTDGGNDDMDGAVDGNISTTWYVDPDDSFNSTFQLTAAGTSSGCEASCIFTYLWPSPYVYVDHEKTGGAQTGLNWANALLTIEEALEIAGANPNVEEIWVAEGTYKLPAGSARGESYELVNNVKLMGGFNGTVQNMLDRVPFATTVMNGDIGVAADSSDNCYHVISVPIGVTGAVVDGMTIAGGNANGASPHDQGGGIFNAGELTVLDCIITDCTATTPGQAAHNKGSGQMTIKGSTILQN